MTKKNPSKIIDNVRNATPYRIYCVSLPSSLKSSKPAQPTASIPRNRTIMPIASDLSNRFFKKITENRATKITIPLLSISVMEAGMYSKAV